MEEESRGLSGNVSAFVINFNVASLHLCALLLQIFSVALAMQTDFCFAVVSASDSMVAVPENAN